METENESYLRQKLEWVKYRLKILDEIEARLKEMKAIAVLASGSDLDDSVRQMLNHRLHLLEKEVNELDEKNLLDGLSVRRGMDGYSGLVNGLEPGKGPAAGRPVSNEAGHGLCQNSG